MKKVEKGFWKSLKEEKGKGKNSIEKLEKGKKFLEQIERKMDEFIAKIRRDASLDWRQKL